MRLKLNDLDSFSAVLDFIPTIALFPGFLKFAIKTADILDRVHGKNLLHNDLNPANILLGTDDSDIRLINFGISAQNQLWSHDKDQDISSSLPYASPERTGRMGHEVDQRSDLYSLGAILYKALTGRPPFICTSSLRYVHANLAQEADSPQVYEPNIPPVIAEIILKLLSKAPEDRYQTAEGLKHDLEACLESMKST